LFHKHSSGRLLIAYHVGVDESTLSLRYKIGVVAVDCEQRLTGIDTVAYFSVHANSDAIVDGRIDSISTSAQFHCGKPYTLGIGLRHIAASTGASIMSDLRLRQQRNVVDNLRIAALRLDHFAELFKRLARSDKICGPRSSFFEVCNRAAEMQH